MFHGEDKLFEMLCFLKLFPFVYICSLLYKLK